MPFKLNSNSDDLIAVVGPCINKKNYEVKIDFFEKFITQDKENENFFTDRMVFYNHGSEIIAYKKLQCFFAFISLKLKFCNVTPKSSIPVR